MSITVKYTGRSSTSGSSPSRERRYTVMNATDIDAAEAALTDGTDVTKPGSFSGIPTTDGGLAIDSLQVDMRENSDTTFDAVATYQTSNSPTPPETGDEEISFEVGSQSVHITQSKATSSFAASGTAPDFKGGIGYDGKSFQGVDVLAEVFSFTLTKYVSAASVTNAFVQNIRDCAFRTNNATFRGMAAGECLFVGASGSKRNDTDYAISYKFMGSKNITGSTVGTITGVSKGGWEYIWALYEDEEDATAKKITPRPTAAYVERLYDNASFTTLLGLTA